MTTNDGGPAFPRPASQLPNGDMCWDQGGMTLRDYFAAAVMPQVVHDYCDSNEAYADRAAEICYAFADAMIQAREGSDEPK